MIRALTLDASIDHLVSALRVDSTNVVLNATTSDAVWSWAEAVTSLGARIDSRACWSVGDLLVANAWSGGVVT